jgi:hypothetical protein
MVTKRRLAEAPLSLTNELDCGPRRDLNAMECRMKHERRRQHASQAMTRSWNYESVEKYILEKGDLWKAIQVWSS